MRKKGGPLADKGARIALCIDAPPAARLDFSGVTAARVSAGGIREPFQCPPAREEMKIVPNPRVDFESRQLGFVDLFHLGERAIGRLRELLDRTAAVCLLIVGIVGFAHVLSVVRIAPHLATRVRFFDAQRRARRRQFTSRWIVATDNLFAVFCAA